jgi:8-oxo-dGTP diphosphatase
MLWPTLPNNFDIVAGRPEVGLPLYQKTSEPRSGEQPRKKVAAVMDLAEFYKSLPKKRIAAGILFFNTYGRLLLVKPTYRPEWLIPGGIVEEDESPRQGCEREVLEELGLIVTVQQLLCTDYMQRDAIRTEGINFVFYGGVLDQGQIDSIRLQAGELSEYRFVPVEEALELLTEFLSRRLIPCIEALQRHTTLYLENGQKVEP